MSTPIILLSAIAAAGQTILKLPHPYGTEFTVQKASANSTESPVYNLVPKTTSPTPLPFDHHNTRLAFTELVNLKSSELPSGSNNSAWARARRAPCTTFYWDGGEAPTLGQVWVVVYALFTSRPDMDSFRLELRGTNGAKLAQQIKDVLLGIDHPPKAREQRDPATEADQSTILVLRSTFWQGAGSPFGPRPVWCPQESPSSLPASTPLGSFPVAAFHNTTTISSAGDPEDPSRYQQSWHPVRPAKPAPGSVIYSRWIPYLNETFSMIALDYTNSEHLRLFHDWQNDPRVLQGWNEASTLEQHRQYLKDLHEDPHKLTVLAKWDDTPFAYFEIYWAKEDRLGGYFDAGDYDRGRHCLVGDVRFRGPHRVSAWWSSLMHYLYLDDPRTMYIVGEPRDTDSTVVTYDFIHGFGLDKFIDLPDKRSAFMRCSRERFFQLCPLGDNEKVVGGMRVGLVPKL
ncbi:putative O-acetyltransferase SAT14 [Paramyrothecium foliicola]|nr:putative O-acetyltransferase SAT14 [Paramyrothecium foliicola]